MSVPTVSHIPSTKKPMMLATLTTQPVPPWLLLTTSRHVMIRCRTPRSDRMRWTRHVWVCHLRRQQHRASRLARHRQYWHSTSPLDPGPRAARNGSFAASGVSQHLAPLPPWLVPVLMPMQPTAACSAVVLEGSKPEQSWSAAAMPTGVGLQPLMLSRMSSRATTSW